jgi:hypothetical protein
VPGVARIGRCLADGGRAVTRRARSPKGFASPSAASGLTDPDAEGYVAVALAGRLYPATPIWALSNPLVEGWGRLVGSGQKTCLLTGVR